MSGINNKLGGFGESIAEKYLKKNGYRILESNYRTPFGELDIIAIDGKTIVFIEVKTRTGLSFGHPIESINHKKKSHLVKSSVFYLKSKDYEFDEYRFDAVSILIDKNGKVNNLELIKNIIETDSDFGG